MLWIPFTLIAAAAQTARNAMQRELTATLGTVGATHVRFLFGFPFAILFLVGVLVVTGSAMPQPKLIYWPWITLGFAAQILATAMMLSAMSSRSFVVTTAYIKPEPVQTALFGLILLGDHVTPLLAAAILIATCGVVLMSYKPGVVQEGGYRPTVMGIVAGGMFGLSAIGYRGAILSLELGDNYVLAATYTLAVGLILQAALLSAWLAWRDMGAFASQFWFLAFALTTAASVRTLALVEVLFAQGISKFIFKQPTTTRELGGIAMIVIGVGLLVWAH